MGSDSYFQKRFAPLFSNLKAYTSLADPPRRSLIRRSQRPQSFEPTCGKRLLPAKATTTGGWEVGIDDFDNTLATIAITFQELHQLHKTQRFFHCHFE